MTTAKPRWTHLVAALFLLVCAIYYYRTNVHHVAEGLSGPSDFIDYHNAAKTMLAGHSPYENPAWFYPPLTAFLLAPFGLTDYVTARWIWFPIQHLLLLTAGFLLWRAIGRDAIAACCVAAVWAFGGAARETFVDGQISSILVLVLVLSYTQRTTRQGVAAGCGFAMKYFPGVVAFALLLNRNWRALRACILVSATGVLIPWLILRFAFSGPTSPTKASYWMGTPAPYNWSMSGILLRVLDPPTRGQPVPYNWQYGNVAAQLHALPEWQALLSLATAASVLLAGLILLVWLCRARLADHQVPWAMIALLSLTLAAAPVCWFHYQVFQYPGLAMLLAYALRRGLWMLAVGIVACAAFLYPIPAAGLENWLTAPPETLYLWSSTAPFACLGLFAIALRVMARCERS